MLYVYFPLHPLNIPKDRLRFSFCVNPVFFVIWSIGSYPCFKNVMSRFILSKLKTFLGKKLELFRPMYISALIFCIRAARLARCATYLWTAFDTPSFPSPFLSGT